MSARTLPRCGAAKDPVTGKDTSVDQAAIGPNPAGRTTGSTAGAGTVLLRTTGAVASGGGCRSAARVSVIFPVCFAPEAAAAFATPPISRTERPRTTAAASSPDGVNDHSFSVIRRPSASNRDVHLADVRALQAEPFGGLLRKRLDVDARRPGRGRTSGCRRSRWGRSGRHITESPVCGVRALVTIG
ncbi:hypothetical protein [Streptomyces sp. AP-93]|uniref:hypothetical protein n=1 Tax=Streptomyces sp. AP-93 TaxID=2929048 RepID=UPI001FAF94CE|nr:hypothetical protein [Streptomyces sp. AP-93]MCJ0872570.1 hypothetical protein [Streptomyces sp. AP-93]